MEANADNVKSQAKPQKKILASGLTATQWLSVISIVSITGIYYKRVEIKIVVSAASPQPQPPPPSLMQVSFDTASVRPPLDGLKINETFLSHEQ